MPLLKSKRRFRLNGPTNENLNADDDPVQILVDEMMSEGRFVRVLEAGAGARSYTRFGPNAHVVGIDISEEQLERNPGLHEKVVGDIQTFPLEPSSFDIILCWDVMEHLRYPDRALHSFVRAIRPGGLIVIGSPVVNSLKGVLTKYTPHWFHVFAHRHIFGNKDAGKPGRFPFPTFLKCSMSPRALQRFARENHLVLEYFNLYAENVQIQRLRKHRLLNLGYTALGLLLKTFSLGYVNPKITDFTIVLRKPPVSQRTGA